MKQFVLGAFWSGLLAAQAPPPRPRPPAAPSILMAVQQAEAGQCALATAQLLHGLPAVRDAATKKRAALAGLSCSTQTGDVGSAVFFAGQLARDFPRDPDALLASVHAFSALSEREAGLLNETAPNSPQAAQINAESLEMQGKTDDAIAAYRRVLQLNPRASDMHYRIGRLLLSKPHTPQTVADARREMEVELQRNPNYAGAEFVLGDLAREAGQWPQAVQHFGRATQLDPSFGDAFVGLGIALLAENQVQPAITALETAERSEPDNPEVHRQLATAYGHVNRPADAQREAALQQQSERKTQ